MPHTESIKVCLQCDNSTFIGLCWHYLGNLSEGCGQELQRLQNRAARTILQCGSSRDTFHLLNWINLISIRKMHKGIVVFRCLDNLSPEYLQRFLIRNSNFHNYNTRRKQDLPKPKNNLGKRTFRYSAIVYFNALPEEIKHFLLTLLKDWFINTFLIRNLNCYVHCFNCIFMR